MTFAGVTADTIVEYALQAGLWGILLAVGIVAGRSLWLFLKPHINDMLKARLRRYEATTALTEGLQQTLIELANQQKQIVALVGETKEDNRRHRKAMQKIAALMEDHRCMYGVDVKGRIFDSDDNGFDKALDEDSSK